VFALPHATRQYLALMDWLGFDEGPRIGRYTRLSLADSVSRTAKPPRVPGRVRRHVRTRADLEAYAELLDRTLAPRPQTAYTE